MSEGDAGGVGLGECRIRPKTDGGGGGGGVIAGGECTRNPLPILHLAGAGGGGFERRNHPLDGRSFSVWS